MTTSEADEPVAAPPRPEPADHGPVEPRGGPVEPRAVDVAAPTVEVTKRTRTSAVWVTAIVSAVVLILLLIFILENQETATLSFLGLSGSLPLGIALLFAAVAGALLVALIGTARILQLRHRVRRANRLG